MTATLAPASAGIAPDDVEIVAFDNVAHAMIRATISVRCGPIVIHGVHLLHDGPGRLFVRVPQVFATLANGRFSQTTTPAMTFPTPDLAAAWRAAVMERLWQQFPRPMRRASEPREDF